MNPRTRTISAFWLLVLLIAGIMPTLAAGAPRDVRLPPGSLPRSEIVEKLERTPEVADRLALRSGEYDVRIRTFPAGAISGIGLRGIDPAQRVFVAEWSQSGSWRVQAPFNPRNGMLLTVPNGQIAPGMPGSLNSTYEEIIRLRTLGTMAVLFCIALVATMWSLSRVLRGVLVMLAIAMVLQFHNVFLERVHRVAFASVLLVQVAALLVLATRSLREGDPASSRRDRSWVRYRTFAWVWGAVAAGIVAWTLWLTNYFRLAIDVASASSGGAIAITSGLSPYGHILNVPGVLARGDTYGPIAYLAYVPAAKLSDAARIQVPLTNAVLYVAVAVALVWLGQRRATLAHGLSAAAIWCSCPMVSVGVIAGHNDIVPAALLMAFALLVGRPGYAGILIALAAATKFLPAAIMPAYLGSVRTTRGRLAALAAAAATSIVVWGLALSSHSARAAFADGVRFQARRDDIQSAWGLLGIGELRPYGLVAAVVFGLTAFWFTRGRGPAATCWVAAGVLSAMLAMLPQWFPTYVTMIMPLVLAGAIYSTGDEIAADREVTPTNADDQRRGNSPIQRLAATHP